MNKKNMKDLEIAPQNSKKPNIKKFKNLQNHNEIQMHLKKRKSKIANFVKAKPKLFNFKSCLLGAKINNQRKEWQTDRVRTALNT